MLPPLVEVSIIVLSHGDSNIPFVAAARCPERRTVDSQMVGKVNVTTFECVDRTPVDLKAAISRTTKRTDVSSSLTNVARQFQNCAGGATDTTCQCPVLCRDDFCTGSLAQAPAQADCVAIDNEFDRTREYQYFKHHRAQLTDWFTSGIILRSIWPGCRCNNRNMRGSLDQRVYCRA